MQIALLFVTLSKSIVHRCLGVFIREKANINSHHSSGEVLSAGLLSHLYYFFT